MAKSNFLIFMVDQMQSYSLGCNGNKQVKTPNLDKLAEQGVTFTRAYCPSPTCMPSRSCFVTGLTSKQHGCITNGTNLPQHLPTIPEVLHQNGYKTYCAGKFHLMATANSGDPTFGHAVTAETKTEWENGTHTALPSPYYGFYETDFVGGHGAGNYGGYKNWLDQNHPDVWAKYKPAKGTLTIDVPPELHYNNWIADKTIDFLDTVGDDNFYAVCSFPDPHAPFTACREYAEMYNADELEISKSFTHNKDDLPFLQERREQFNNRKNPRTADQVREFTRQTYGMITHIDDNVGRVMEKLREIGKEDNTVICFVADHGEYLGCHDLIGKAEWLYEELVRIPFIVKLPNSVKHNACDHVVSTLDFAPTVLNLAGLEPTALSLRNSGHAKPLPLAGQDLTDYLTKGEPLSKNYAVVEFDEDWHAGENYRERVIVTQDYKLAIFPEIGDGMLFDLKNDQAEKNNLFNHPDYKDVKAELMQQLLYYLVRTDRQDLPRPVAF